jgi:hypothetical protein
MQKRRFISAKKGGWAQKAGSKGKGKTGKGNVYF